MNDSSCTFEQAQSKGNVSQSSPQTKPGNENTVLIFLQLSIEEVIKAIPVICECVIA